MFSANSILRPVPLAGRLGPAILRSQAGWQASPRACGIAASYLSLPFLLWLGLWFGINTGHWVLRQLPTTPMGWIHFARTVFPFFAVLAAIALLGNRGGGRLWRQTGPVRLWFVYGAVSLLACVSSPYLLAGVYWSIMYLAVFPIMLLALEQRNPLGSAIRLNRFNFVVATLFLIAMVVVARDALFVGSGLETSAYGVSNRAEAIEGAYVSRSSGFARFGGVVGILSLIYLWQTQGSKRILWVIPFLLATMFLYTLQSRGAIVAYVVTIVLLIGLKSFESRRVLLVPAALLLGLALFADSIPFDRIKEHITRAEDLEGLETLGGRTDSWRKAVPAILESPLWGYGMQADRYILREDYSNHVHNTYMYALISAGILGTAAFVAGLVWAWVLLARGVKCLARTRVPPDPFFYEAAGILTFFTVRSISEVCGPMFGVDYMLMLPVLAYLGLSRHSGPAAGTRPARSVPRQALTALHR